MSLRAIFLGTPEFAVPSLRSLATDERISVELVVTQPDRPAGRGRRLTAPAVKAAAQALDLPVFQPASLRDDAVLDELETRLPDLLVVIAYGELLNRRALRLARHGALNVHPSLLPRYRGAAPIPAAILNGDAETGVSIMRLIRKLDAGPVIAQQRCAIAASETAGQLEQRLANVAAEILPETCVEWAAGRLSESPQDDALATYTREWARADVRIDWEQPATQIERLVRAANPRPTAWTRLGESDLRILEAAVVPAGPDAPPGTVTYVGRSVIVTCGSNGLRLERVRPAGRPNMDATGWWNGLRMDVAQFS